MDFIVPKQGMLAGTNYRTTTRYPSWSLHLAVPTILKDSGKSVWILYRNNWTRGEAIT